MKKILLLPALLLFLWACKKDIIYSEKNVHTQQTNINSVFIDPPRHNLPWTVYRGDGRAPEEIRDAGGFYPRYKATGHTPKYSLYKHTLGRNKEHTPFISTSEDIKFAADWVKDSPTGYIYVIEPRDNFISTQGTLINYNFFPHQREWAALEHIPWNQVMGWYVTSYGRVVNHFINTDYVPQTGEEISRPTYSRFDLAGFPPGHPALSESPWGNSCTVCINPSHNPRLDELSDECTYTKSVCFDAYESIKDYLKLINHESPKAKYMDIPAVSAIFSYGEDNFTNNVLAINKEGRLINIKLPEQGNQGVGASRLISQGKIVNVLGSFQNIEFLEGFDAATLYKYKNQISPSLLLFKDTTVAEYDFNESTGSVKRLIGSKPLVEKFPFLKNTTFENGIDAVFSVPGKDWVYFSKGYEGAFADLNEGKLFEINNITTEWPLIFANSPFADSFDAAFCVKSPYQGSSYWVFFFKGREFKVISFELTKNAVSVNQMNRGGDDILTFQAFQRAHW